LYNIERCQIYKQFIYLTNILYITAIGDRGTLHPDGTGIYTKKN